MNKHIHARLREHPPTVRQVLPTGGQWPTHQQESLIRAALLSGDEALYAWQTWKAATDIDNLDLGSQQLLPLLYRNLRTHEVDDPSLGRLKGLHRRTWYDNQRLFAALMPLLRGLQQANIDPLLIKGSALTPAYYNDYGSRPMVDADILVARNQAHAALDVLMQHGWQPHNISIAQLSDNYIKATHARKFVNPHGQACDLHWHLIHEEGGTPVDREWQTQARRVDVQGLSVRVLHPTDQLLHICIHGPRWDFIPALRWIADANTVLRADHATINWDRFIRHARSCRLTLQIKDALTYLRELLDAPIPATVIERLRTSPTGPLERLEYRTFTRPPNAPGLLVRGYAVYRRAAHHGVVQRGPLGFARYLQHNHGLSHLWQVPLIPPYRRLRRRWTTAPHHRLKARFPTKSLLQDKD